jgi:hypothetical protein
MNTLSQHCEICLYSIIPAILIENIIVKCCPGLRSYISCILGYDELTFSDDKYFVYKDLNLLKMGRSEGQNKLLVADHMLSDKCRDPNIKGVEIMDYKGGINYPHILSLIIYAKNYNK